jgi:transformation/transcription domain-associated protein
VKKQQDYQAKVAAAKRAAELAKIAAANNSDGDVAMTEVKDENGVPAAPNSATIPPLNVPTKTSQPLELVEELMSNLKTNFPLLALTMEKMVDQISLRAKPSSEEDIYRFFAALLADALQVSHESD